MTLTSKALGRGRRLAAGSLIAVAALALTACQEGSGSGSHAAPASSPTAAGQDATRPSGVDTQPSGDGPSAGAKESAAPTDAPGAGNATSASPGHAPGKATPGAKEEPPSALAASDRCTSAQMSLSLGAPDAGAGNFRYPLTFTNKGKKACTLRGYPGVSLISRDGTRIGRPATREGGAGGVVRLAPGASAHALVHTVNDGVSDTPCWKRGAYVYVYAPGSKESMTTGSGNLRVCGGEFTITAVEPGTFS
ncbi:DUF4232 domain-containing protein [Streptomyces benahoarensis]|uniref:DUF4232 domain-containing protein n=1 Tax=Streptomyces benahoarensis TaxID=2595054 RepID=A0A553ZLA6_9ACTN|nr:DUF4232 domain-containing protein [Streptomyces benahoarensis]TSB22504.1 DUF4232 domain-containing protein [Streptomyces benahoarensis]TSB42252.1 DUF4232 domain-containing protein [Streptomyces benahoarensis]